MFGYFKRIFLITFFCCASASVVDYTDLAKKAMMNRHNIFKFLNDSSIRSEFQKLYRKLLAQIQDDISIPVSKRRDVSIEISSRRIIDGRNTSIEEVPWQVSLRYKTGPICGGSVATATWIITAAHCLIKKNASDLSVRLGSSWKTHGGEIYDIKNIYVHPHYDQYSKTNDIGLLELYTPLRFSARVMPIKIVDREKQVPADLLTIVSGWGKLKEDGPSTTSLQSTAVPTIAMKQCKKSGFQPNSIDPASMFCAGLFIKDSPDSCQGDSGGPIVSNGELIGVVSWGLGCARGNFPGVYSRLASPLIWDWVQKHIAKHENTNNITLLHD